MIDLISFLQAAGVGVRTEGLKLHLAGWNGHEHPIDVFHEGRFDEWQQRQNQKNFECSQVLALINLGYGNWMFAGVYARVDRMDHPVFPGEHRYTLNLLPGQDDLIARVIVRHHRRDRGTYVWYRPEKHALEIAEIRREKLSIGDFPGYREVCLSHARLRIITGQKLASWHGALAHAKGVYVITDTSTGKLYVGKADGKEGLWQRWCNYAADGHGGNKELKALIDEHGFDYAKNFQYSLLEILGPDTTDEEVLRRESFWMTALGTRQHGLNWGSKEPIEA